MNSLEQNNEKIKIVVRSKLQGMKFFKALKAMEFAAQYHKGVRKDGNPEFSHQISQVALALTLLDHLIYPENTICVIFLHDICEDYDVPFDTIKELFGKKVRDAVFLMSKQYKEDGQIVKKDNEQYYLPLSNDCIASFAKGCDRIHNLLTMLGGFKEEKQKSYIKETLEFTVPMLKKARRLHPEQEGAYENIKFIMTNQIQLYNTLHKK